MRIPLSHKNTCDCRFPVPSVDVSTEEGDTVNQSLSSQSTAQLSARLKCRLIKPGDNDYDEARAIFLGGFDCRPALIARPRDASDVAEVVLVARESGVALAVRSGGHSGAGHSTVDGGIVLDLRDLKALDIDPIGRTAWAETGLSAAEYTAAAGRHGLATGFGDTGSVGIGGITLSGGIGYLVRKHGLTIDNYRLRCSALGLYEKVRLVGLIVCHCNALPLKIPRINLISWV